MKLNKIAFSSHEVVQGSLVLLLGCLANCSQDDVNKLADNDVAQAQNRLKSGPACNKGSHTAAAEVRRTSFGVPHIKASDERGIGYGIGYAYAEDNLCLWADAIVTVNGERSKYFGPDGSYDPNGSGTAQTNLSSDFFFKYLNEPALIQSIWQRQTHEVKELIRGYTAGYNRYLGEVGKAGLPDACKNQPWVRQLTAQDLIRLAHYLAVNVVAPTSSMRFTRPNHLPSPQRRRLEQCLQRTPVLHCQTITSGRRDRTWAATA